MTSRDGSIEISGVLRTFDGEFYRIETEFGELVLDGQGVLCDGVGCPNLEDYVAELRFAGAPDLGAVLLPALFEAYAARRGLQVARQVVSDGQFQLELRDKAARRDVARIAFSLSSTAEGFADLLAGEADIAMAVREIRANEATRGDEAGLGDLRAPAQSKIVALDALVPVVARGNPIKEISVEDMAAILSGDITEWPGGKGPLLLHGRNDEAGIQQSIQDRILAPVGRAATAARVSHDSDAALADAVARDPLAFAVTRYSEVGNAVAISLTGACGRAIAISQQKLKSGDYPFTAPLFLYMPARRQPLFLREFFRYLNGPPAQLVIRRAGFVDRNLERTRLNAQGDRLASAIAAAGSDVPLTELQNMLATLDGAERLSTTFRFRPGSPELEPQSASDLADLAQALESGLFDGRELIFSGFSDGAGDWASNRQIARKRAETVLQAVRKRAFTADLSRTQLSAYGFGEALPMACDDAAWGRAVNRRVEVWLR